MAGKFASRYWSDVGPVGSLGIFFSAIGKLCISKEGEIQWMYNDSSVFFSGEGLMLHTSLILGGLLVSLKPRVKFGAA